MQPKIDIFEFLSRHEIAFDRYDHPALFTCEDAERHVLNIPGTGTKNLFLRDKKGEKHYLVVVPHSKQVDLVSLASVLQSTRFSMGSPERLERYLGVTPGSVTLLALVNDADRLVQLVIDKTIWESTQIQCHPLVNTSTLVLDIAGVQKFFSITGHQALVLDVPRAK